MKPFENDLNRDQSKPFNPWHKPEAVHYYKPPSLASRAWPYAWPVLCLAAVVLALPWAVKAWFWYAMGVLGQPSPF